MRGFAHVLWSVVGGISVSPVYSELKVPLKSLTGPVPGFWHKETKCSFFNGRKDRFKLVVSWISWMGLYKLHPNQVCKFKEANMPC